MCYDCVASTFDRLHRLWQIYAVYFRTVHDLCCMKGENNNKKWLNKYRQRRKNKFQKNESTIERIGRMIHLTCKCEWWTIKFQCIVCVCEGVHIDCQALTFVSVDIIGTIDIHLSVWIYRHAYFTNVRINFACLKSIIQKNKNMTHKKEKFIILFFRTKKEGKKNKK